MSPQSARKPKILVADDSRFQLELFRTTLEDKGFEVTVAQDALQAGMFALRTLPDAIILDLSMPGGSGIQVLQRLKCSTKTKLIPVVIATASDDPALQQVAASLGAAQFFHKPVDLELLAKTLADVAAPVDAN